MASPWLPAVVPLIALPLAWALIEDVLRRIGAPLTTLVFAIVALEWASVAVVFALRAKQTTLLSSVRWSTLLTGAAVSAITLVVALPHVTIEHRPLLVLLVCVGAPTAGLAEEFLFRGVAIDAVAETTHKMSLAGIISTIAFILLHQPSTLSAIEFYAVFGLAMWGVYRLARSLVPGMLLHWAWDAVVAALLLTGRLS